jgi:hypothetical protein
MQKTVTSEFIASLNRLVGQVCWGFVAGEGTGSVISLNIGGKVLRKSPLKNPHLSAEQRKYDAEFDLFIQCAWRLESKTQVICGAWDDNAKGGDMLEGLQRLTGQVISSIKVSKPALDLTVSFSSELMLRVFCDQTNQAEMQDNYSVFLPDAVYVVGTRSELKREAGVAS